MSDDFWHCDCPVCDRTFSSRSYQLVMWKVRLHILLEILWKYRRGAVGFLLGLLTGLMLSNVSR